MAVELETGSLYVDQARLELTEIHVLLPPECNLIRL